MRGTSLLSNYKQICLSLSVCALRSPRYEIKQTSIDSLLPFSLSIRLILFSWWNQLISHSMRDVMWWDAIDWFTAWNFIEFPVDKCRKSRRRPVSIIAQICCFQRKTRIENSLRAHFLVQLSANMFRLYFYKCTVFSQVNTFVVSSSFLAHFLSRVYVNSVPAKVYLFVIYRLPCALSLSSSPPEAWSVTSNILSYFSFFFHTMKVFRDGRREVNASLFCAGKCEKWLRYEFSRLSAVMFVRKEERM